MSKRSPSPQEKVSPLDPISEWRAWQALTVWFTVRLNRQLQRRWKLEHQIMQDRPVSQRFRPVIFLEPVPSLRQPRLSSSATKNSARLEKLKTKARLLRARVEKGKELASEIERRILDPRVKFPTHFCHTCVQGGEETEVLLTKCGHRVCRTCLSFGVDANEVYECSICFAPAELVTRSPLSTQRSCSEHISSLSMKLLPESKRAVSWGTPLVKP
ncbi:hypothetical protein N7474_000444 [Penicillium riverlandense]|uniref:uncharacterized protein n=1 Tax=Penicillium riverlandense TaxID=1903569 RepID=UPI002549BF1B|nr:uncharacterized protein N7474_000444 [Penicillium riverlandense]KAJ5832133.1 hypothetical protein N7474_000444 [Penicillium riverlandense]